MLLLPHLNPGLLCFLDLTVVQAAATTDRVFQIHSLVGFSPHQLEMR
jgi:hypothetical protein